MAVATPVLERKVNTAEESAERTYEKPFVSADELHNSLIKDNYARLINPDYHKIEELRAPAPAQEAAPVYESMIAPEKPYLVENARADAAIFRADSEINRVLAQSVADFTVDQTAVEIDEEENEDLRPTNTTIQYKTIGVAAVSEESVAPAMRQVSTVATRKAHALSKKEKIIIATFVSVVLALFVLVIVNSAIIANLNTYISTAQANLETVRGALAGVNSDIAAKISMESIAEFAQNHNMVLR